MVKKLKSNGNKVYYSTLNQEIFDSKKEAQKAEDKYVEEYFKNLDKKAQIKRKMIQSFLSTTKNQSF